MCGLRKGGSGREAAERTCKAYVHEVVCEGEGDDAVSGNDVQDEEDTQGL